MSKFFGNLFRDTSIPVTEQVVKFTQARQNVLAGNIANLDTPGYKVRDLSVEDFHARLRDAIDYRDQGGKPGSIPAKPGRPHKPGVMMGNLGASGENSNDDVESYFAQVSKNPKLVLHHDKSNVNMEGQVSEMTKNHIEHNMALTLMNSQFSLLTSVISERV